MVVPQEDERQEEADQSEAIKRVRARHPLQAEEADKHTVEELLSYECGMSVHIPKKTTDGKTSDLR